MTKPKKHGVPSHYVYGQTPKFAKFVNDDERPTVVRIVPGEMSISRKGLTKEDIEYVKKIYCEDIDNAFRLYLHPIEKRHR